MKSFFNVKKAVLALYAVILLTIAAGCGSKESTDNTGSFAANSGNGYGYHGHHYAQGGVPQTSGQNMTNADDTDRKEVAGTVGSAETDTSLGTADENITSNQSTTGEDTTTELTTPEKQTIEPSTPANVVTVNPTAPAQNDGGNTAAPTQCQHHYVVSHSHSAGCEHHGNRKYYCSKCGAFYEETLPASGHHYNTTVIPPTCTSDGYTCHTCSDCGSTYNDNYVGRTNHTYDNGSVKTSATDYSPGVMLFTCTQCGTAYEQNYALPHTIDIGGGQTITVCGYWDLAESDEIFRLLNEYRVENGLNALQKTEALDAAARTRALECSYLFSHDRPNSSSCFTAFPSGYIGCGENIAAGYYNAAAVMAGWKSSPGHNANMLTSDFNYVGVSLFRVIGNDGAGYGAYYTQNFMTVR